MDQDVEEDGEDDEMTGGDVAEVQEKIKREEAINKLLKSSDDLVNVARVANSKLFKELMKKIDDFKKQNRDWTAIIGPVEEDPEYKVIVQANNIVPDVESDILVIHKYVIDHYSDRFPELHDLVKTPLDYMKTVKVLKNHLDTINNDLRAVLGSAAVSMFVNVTASTTKGKPIPEDQLKKALDGCDMALALEDAKIKILQYIESRMSIIAPNISAILGSSVAAKVIGAAGGLTGLCKIPACNLSVLGQSKKTNTGLSNIGMQRHVGYIHDCELVRKTPSDYKRKAVRLVAAKTILAARMDLSRQYKDGSMGRQYEEEIDKKLEKAMEPPPIKNIKALPAPNDAPRKKRGGRRARKMKEMYAVTEARKQANRMAFGVAESEAIIIDDTEGLGLLGGATGKVRAAVTDTKTKGLIGGTTTSTTTHTSGLASSLAFTPVQGLEFVNPELQQQRIKEANDKWFSNDLGFVRVQKKEEKKE
ncbi:U4/U6 small nuclear ribonucleoprotein Prp31-like protein [Paraphysoderma sedebokerense]|nr:U4/U6 small nuclear ribonucleoprotein Prp31-like protein [Paraphysoderma sedebokerense]